MSKNIKVVILAGGLGTRLKKITKNADFGPKRRGPPQGGGGIKKRRFSLKQAQFLFGLRPMTDLTMARPVGRRIYTCHARRRHLGSRSPS